MSTVTRVQCDKVDCLFHTTRVGDPLCNCTHPKKPMHLKESVCPLYRLDWNKSSNQATALKERFLKR